MAVNDPLVKNIQKQLALNSGDIGIINNNGNYQYVSTRTGQPITQAGNAGSSIVGQAGSTTTITVQAQVYNYAKGLFGGETVPPDLIEVMANLATWYAVNTGTNVSDLFKNGQLQKNFIATINNLRDPSGQIGFSNTAATPAWTNNYLIGPNVLAARGR